MTPARADVAAARARRGPTWPGRLRDGRGRNEIDVRPRAVVVGAHVNGLGVVRSLGQAGVDVIVAGTSPWQPAFHSRYATGTRRFAALHGPAFVDDLLNLGRSLSDRPVLFLTTDWSVRAVSEHRERIAEHYLFRLPHRGDVDMLLNKVRFQQFADEHGLPVPRAVVIREERDLAGLAELEFPVIVKPCTTDHVERARVPRACRARSRGEAERVCRMLLYRIEDDVLVQEWIDGPDAEIYFCLQYHGERGATVTSFTGRKLLSWPPGCGSTATATAAPPDVAKELESLTTGLFDFVGVEGMCGMEWKRDPRSGRFLIIEPTVGRPDWQEEIATLYGVNIPFAACCYELGWPVTTAAVDRPFVWRETLGYWRARLATRSLRDPVPADRMVKSTWWRPDDPLPGFFFVHDALVRAHRKLRSRGERAA